MGSYKPTDPGSSVDPQQRADKDDDAEARNDQFVKTARKQDVLKGSRDKQHVKRRGTKTRI